MTTIALDTTPMRAVQHVSAPRSPGFTASGFLSNDCPVPGGVPIVVDDDRVLRGDTVQHVFQALRTTSREGQRMVLRAETPERAVLIGKALVLRPDWIEVEDGIMWACLEVKFAVPALGEMLLATGRSQIVSTNEEHDLYWGRCLCSAHRGEGRNRLGEMLVLRRTLLRTGQR